MTTLRTAALAAVVTATLSGTATANRTVSTSARAATAPADSYVAEWNAIAFEAISQAELAPSEDGVILTYQAIAVHDAVVAIDGSFEPFAVDIDASTSASPQAAAVAAAYGVLAHYLPEQAATVLDPAYAASLETIPDGDAERHGVAVGEQAAAAVVEQRADDGFRSSSAYTPSTLATPATPATPGAWVPTADTPPIGVYLATMRPFSLEAADQFRPAGPPELTSEQWANDYDEVRELGSETSVTRTDEQLLAARFWAEPPSAQEHATLRRLIADRQLDIVDAARLVAMVAVADTDALIACFDAKYHHLAWRPITAIRAGASDGNDATVADPGWSPSLPTPNHPEYPAAHTCSSAAQGRVIAAFLGTDQIELTAVSVTDLGDRHFATVADLEAEVANARIWGGMHFRFAVDDGLEIGRQVAEEVLADFAAGDPQGGLPRVR